MNETLQELHVLIHEGNITETVRKQKRKEFARELEKKFTDAFIIRNDSFLLRLYSLVNHGTQDIHLLPKTPHPIQQHKKQQPQQNRHPSRKSLFWSPIVERLFHPINYSNNRVLRKRNCCMKGTSTRLDNSLDPKVQTRKRLLALNPAPCTQYLVPSTLPTFTIY